MPQSRHRKINKARKRPKGQYPAVNATSSASGRGNNSGTTRTVAIVIVLAIAVTVIGYLIVSRRSKGAEVTTPSGLKYSDLVVGTGATPQRGQTVTVHYTGTLENGHKFDSSYDHVPPAPSDFAIGVGKVIKGWDEGLMTMKVGGKRHLIIPSKLGYGAAGRPPDIPGNSTLIFDVELVGVK